VYETGGSFVKKWQLCSMECGSVSLKGADKGTGNVLRW